MGALVVLVDVQVSVLGLYVPPVFKAPDGLLIPPQTIISLPVHMRFNRHVGLLFHSSKLPFFLWDLFPALPHDALK